MSIHQRIKERRLALGLNSHKALAALVGVSWQTVQLWEKEGGTAPNRNRIEMVAQVLGVTPGWLQNGGQDATPKKQVSAPETLADALKLTTETSKELRLLTIYRLSDENGQLLIDQAVDSAGRDIDLGSAFNERE
jgi:transcriptional regulator with XRE-family HTH domain